MGDKQIVPIYTLSGGVSRQPASKRTPYQAENLDNCMISLERSLEKRPGFSMLSGVGVFDLSFLPLSAQPYFTWYQLDRDNRFLIIIDRAATRATDSLFYVLKVDESGWVNQTPFQQWDPTDVTLNWNGSDIIEGTDPRWKIYSQIQTSQSKLTDYNALKALGILSLDTRNYITFESGKPREVLRNCQIGTNIFFLNTKVYAGFTSGTGGKTVALNGLETDTVDTVGNKITYYTATRIRKTSDGRMYPESYTLRDGEEFDSQWVAQFIPVEDYVFGDFEKPWLGQSVRNFGELRFPPDNNDWTVNNSNVDMNPDETSARDMLRISYDPTTPFYSAGSSPADGRGKIYFCDAPYLSLDAGFYRIISFPEGQTYSAGAITEEGAGKPYTQKVRTPDYCSVIDNKRMPQRLLYNNGSWSFQPIDWSSRTVGDRVTNPGPSPFLTPDGEARHVQLSSMANFRDRLFFSSGDVIFSSQLGVLEDLWIKDPSNITVSDPIDVRAANNSYAEITAMIPFNAYLFINTRGGVQFELKGENNLISPLTAEVSSTTFYSTADLVDPQTLGSQIYFFDKERLYIYLNEDSREFNTAVELSNTVRGYLPKNYQDVATAVAQNYLLAVDEDAKNNLYIYCNRFDGNQLLQSSFWRYVLSPSDEIYGVKAWDDHMYVVVKRNRSTGSSWYLMSNYLEQEELDVPRMDAMYKLQVTGANVSARAVETTITVPYLLPDAPSFVVLADGFGSESGTVFATTSVSTLSSQSTLKISGIDLTEHIGKYIYVGVSFNMVAELSQQFIRDNGNNIIEGSLNLKTLQVRHSNTGHYRVEVTRRGRQNKLISEFSATNTENTDILTKDGVFTAKIFGFADETKIEIINDSLAPCNITQMEFKTVFNRNNSSMR